MSGLLAPSVPGTSAVMLLASLAMLIVSLRPRLFHRPDDAKFIRFFLAVPFALLVILIASGGDGMHRGWRFIVPLLPTLVLGLGVGAHALRSDRLRTLAFTMLGLLVVERAFEIAKRPNMPAATLDRWPANLANIGWQKGEAQSDAEVGEVLAASFPRTSHIAQSDYLRLGAHLVDHYIADLSGLVNARLAHTPHAPAFSLLTCRALLDENPEACVYGWSVYPRAEDLTRYELTDPEARPLLTPWPCQGTAEEFQEVVARYRSASIALRDGRFVNLLVRSDHHQAHTPGSPNMQLHVRGDASEPPGTAE